MFKYYNPNPEGKNVGDCVIRAVSNLLSQSWDQTYIDICICGLIHHDMPSGNAVWGKYLADKGYRRGILPDKCPACYTVRDFAEEHPEGSYLLVLDSHVVSVIDGDYFDTWDSGDGVPAYYWTKE